MDSKNSDNIFTLTIDRCYWRLFNH